MIKSSVLYKNKNGNCYFFDIKKKKTTLCHPVLFWLIEKHEKGEDLGQWLENLGEESITLNNQMVSKETLWYYYERFLLLEKKGYFSKLDIEEKISITLSPDDVESAMVNTEDITFEVTDACNLNCEYCGYGRFYQNYDKRDCKMMDVRIAKNFLDYFSEKLNSSLNKSHKEKINIGFYGGEPLLNFSFIKEILEYVKKLDFLHNRLAFNMTTNGLLLNKYMDFLADYNFSLLVSLDGNEFNNGYRVFNNGHSSFKQVYANLKLLKKKYPLYFDKKVNFNAVLHDKNSLSDINHFFNKEFSKSPRLSSLSVIGINQEFKEEFKAMYRDIYKDLKSCQNRSNIEDQMFISLPHLKDLLRFFQTCSHFIFQDYNELFTSWEKVYHYPTGTCLPFGKRIFVTVNGKLLPCETIGQGNPLGQVTSEGVSIDFKKIADTYNKWYANIRKKCSSCYFSEMCDMCLYYLEDFPENYQCRQFANYKNFSQYLASKSEYLENNPQFYKKLLETV